MWTGIEVSQQDYVALLMCIAVDGYHTVCSYQWCKSGYNLTDEVYPLLYATSVGEYECSVTTKTEVMRQCFEVKGITFIIV